MILLLQFTDDTSMALCLANSLLACCDFVPYDQLLRYKWWYKNGYMSSTGVCFDIGGATKNALDRFEHRQRKFAEKNGISLDKMESLVNLDFLHEFNVNCGDVEAAGNGALMRLSPVPIFFYKHPIHAVEYSGASALLTHGSLRVRDACRYYGALIVAALEGASREELLDKDFYENHKEWFGETPLHEDIMRIANGSYQVTDGFNKGIRGTGYVVNSLEGALWAFWSDEGSFKKGVLAAVNLGDDTDTTAAIYGQLAGAFYGFKKLPKEWREQVYAKKFIETLSLWLIYDGSRWKPKSPMVDSCDDQISFRTGQTERECSSPIATREKRNNNVSKSRLSDNSSVEGKYRSSSRMDANSIDKQNQLEKSTHESPKITRDFNRKYPKTSEIREYSL
jgi:ADP-ribosyl-[dinitrogen reductase] hydrolase